MVIRNCLRGSACATSCSTYGMFSTGVAKPDIRIVGIANANVPSTACCCVWHTGEIIKPTPAPARMNSTIRVTTTRVDTVRACELAEGRCARVRLRGLDEREEGCENRAERGHDEPPIAEVRVEP